MSDVVALVQTVRREMQEKMDGLTDAMGAIIEQKERDLAGREAGQAILERSLEARVAEVGALQRDLATAQADAESWHQQMQDREETLLRVGADLAAARARIAEAERLVFTAFVRGVEWWQFRKYGSTIFPSERDEAESEAKSRYPYTRTVDRMQRDALQARIAALTGAVRWALSKLDRGDGVLEYTGPVEEGERAKAVLIAPDLALGERWKAMERLLKVLDRCQGNRGWLSCVPTHDCRCEKDRNISDKCTCGAEEYRDALGELDKVTP